MGKSSPKTPAAPDPVATAAAQTQSNISTADNQSLLNQVDQQTPYGSLTYEYPTNDPNHAVAVEQLSPAEQQNLNNTQQAQSIYGQAAINQLTQASNSLSTPITAGSIPSIGPSTIGVNGQVQGSVGGPQLFGAQQQQLQQALAAQLQPQLDQQDKALTQSLRNQGLTPGSDAYNNAMRQQAQSDTAAQLQTVQAGDQLQQQMFGQNLASGQFANQALAQQLSMQQTQGNYADQQSQLALSQATALQELPINEAAALLTGQQVQQPSFMSVPQTGVAPTNVAGIYQNSFSDADTAAMQQYQAQAQAMGSTAGGIGGLASLGLMAAFLS